MVNSKIAMSELIPARLRLNWIESKTVPSLMDTSVGNLGPCGREEMNNGGSTGAAREHIERKRGKIIAPSARREVGLPAPKALRPAWACPPRYSNPESARSRSISISFDKH
jgi:hypothetical protein